MFVCSMLAYWILKVKEYMYAREKNRRMMSLILSSSLLGCISAEGGGRCSLFGRQHIHTFDGVIYEFPGDCSYKLAGDCHHRTFSILGNPTLNTTFLHFSYILYLLESTFCWYPGPLHCLSVCRWCKMWPKVCWISYQKLGAPLQQ